MSLKKRISHIFIRIDRFLGWFEIRPLKTLAAISRYSWYRQQYLEFRKTSSWLIKRYPCLFDHDQQSATLGEYFWQDLYVARRVSAQNPRRHIDVGSRIDGFIAHLAVSRKVEVFDIRPLHSRIEGVSFSQWDITQPDSIAGKADCISCLHTLEHIGLGRYGDQLDADGWKIGFRSLVSLMENNAILWLSVPVGSERVEFNAHRVFNPSTIADYAATLGLRLKEFAYLDDEEIVISQCPIKDFQMLARRSYALGIFTFTNDSSGG